MTAQGGIGYALAELVKRLTPEEKREFARALSWEEVEALRHQGSGPSSIEQRATQPAHRVGDPRVYVSAVSEGLALELPIECVAAFVKCMPTILAVSWVEVYVRRNGRGEEYRVNANEFGSFLDVHQDELLQGSFMIELGRGILVSGGGGCLHLALEGISGEVRRRLAVEALHACGFDYEFVGDSFTASVWDDKLEVSDR